MTRAFPRALLGVFLLVSLAVGAAFALQSNRGLLDFGAFYMAGVADQEGLDPYGVYPELAAETGEDFGYTDGRGHSPNLNPPISLYPFRLLVDADPATVMWGLNIVSAVAFAACGYALLRAYPQHRNPAGILWLAGFGGFWYTLWLGQVYVLLFVVGLAAWLLIRRGTHPIVAGVLIGLLVAVKPHFVLWPAFLLLARHPRVALPALAVAAATSAIPSALEGPAIYEQWLDAAAAYPRVALAGNASLVGQAARLGVEPFGYAAAAVLVAASAAIMFRSRATALRASSWALVVASLASPIAWIGYGLLLLPVLLARTWQTREWVVAIGMTGIWFVLGIGEIYFLATGLLMFLLAKDQLVSKELSQSVDAARVTMSHRPRIAA